MATSKTLSPTNVTISIPAMTDVPDASVFSNCVDKEADAINALNNKILSIYEDENLTIPAGSTVTVTINRGTYTRTNNYGVVSYVPIMDRATYVLVTLKEISDTEVTFICRNLNTSTNVETPLRIVLYFIKL